jgi:hypothetical protein
MNRTEALTEVLRDPTRSEKDRDIARAALDAAHADRPDPTLSELLQVTGKPLQQITYHEVHAFCSARGWPRMRDLYDRWLDAYWATERGRKDAERIAGYLRQHDLDEWGAGLRDWKKSNFKRSDRLIRALEVIADSPNRGNYHDPEIVSGASKFLAEMKRRTSQGAMGN